MIAACPKCRARYRVQKEKLRPEGVRLRCSQCEAVFRVRAPQPAPKPAAPAEVPVAAPPEPQAPVESRVQPPVETPVDDVSPPPDPERPRVDAGAEGKTILIGAPDEEVGKRTVEWLETRGVSCVLVHDGVEAMLEIQRRLPEVVVLWSTLPRMYGFQICEIVKRNESLRHLRVVLVGAIHHKDRYRRPPEDLYGADRYVEEPDLPDGLAAALEGEGVLLRTPDVAPAGDAAPPDPVEAPPPPPMPEPASMPTPEEPTQEAPMPVAPPVAGAPTTTEEPAGEGLEAARAEAERLARIIVSDIVLYNEEKFSAAIEAGEVVQAMAGDLDEGRALFQGRIDPRVRDERDHLADELVRVARARGMG